MKKKNESKIWIVATVFMALMVTSAFAVLAIGIVSATTWYVEEGASIQAAVDAASPGDVIIARDGIYTENIDVNKRLTIMSENGSASTIVQATNPNDHVFEVTGDYVNISRFTVKGAGFPLCGIDLSSVDCCNISNNNASNNGFGINLDHSSNNIITNNTVTNNDYGIHLSYSSNNTLNNNIANSDGQGISCLIRTATPSQTITPVTTPTAASCCGIQATAPSQTTLQTRTVTTALSCIIQVAIQSQTTSH